MRKVNRKPPLGGHVPLHARDVVVAESLHCNDESTATLVALSRAKIPNSLQCVGDFPILPVMARVVRVVLPQFGAFLVSLRDARGWNQSEAAHRATRQRLAVSYQALRGLEEGKTKNPEPALLRGIAALYKVPYEELVRRFIAERYGVEIAGKDFTAALEAALVGRVVLEEEERALLSVWHASRRDIRAAALRVLRPESEGRPHGGGKDHRRRASGGGG